MQTAGAQAEPIPEDVRAESRIVIESERWTVGMPLTPNAMFWWGAFTHWCVAADSALFADYVERGPLVIFRSRQTSFRWALHPVTGEFRNVNNRRASWSGFVMRNPDIAAGLLMLYPISHQAIHCRRRRSCMGWPHSSNSLDATLAITR